MELSSPRELVFTHREIEALPATHLLSLKGSVSGKNSGDFNSLLVQLQQKGFVRFVMDMENVAFIDSVALASMVSIADDVSKAGGGLALVKISPKVKHVFESLGVSLYFHFVNDVQEALAHFQRKMSESPVAPTRTSGSRPGMEEKGGGPGKKVAPSRAKAVSVAEKGAGDSGAIPEAEVVVESAPEIAMPEAAVETVPVESIPPGARLGDGSPQAIEVPPAAAKKVCPNKLCGFVNKPIASFCARCGAKL